MKEGDRIPDFSLKDGSGRVYTPEDFKGSWLALFFYIKDNTSG